MFTKTKTMKNLLAVLLIAFSLNGFAQHKESSWHTDVNKAIELSVKQEKPLFFFFTGSDWCGWCKKLVAEVFEKAKFKTWATQNVILVEIDFPRRTPISKQLRKQNEELMRAFGPVYQRNYGRRMGYPTGFFVNPTVKDGKVNLLTGILGVQGYVRGGPTEWIAGANQILKNK